MTWEPGQQRLIEELADAMARHTLERMEREIPESGRFRPIAVTFDIPGAENAAYLAVECTSGAPERERSLILSVLRNGTDRAHRNLLTRGEKSDLAAYLRSEGLAQMLAGIRTRSEGVDAYWDADSGSH